MSGHMNTEDEGSRSLNLIDIARRIWKGKKVVIFSALAFVIFGIFYVITAPKEYESESTVLIETNTSSGMLSGILAQFSGLAGVNLDTKTKEALIPELYPEVITSTPFLMQLMNEKIIESKYDSAIIVRDYVDRYIANNYMKEYSVGLFAKLKKLVKGGSSAETRSKQMIKTDSGSTPIILTQDDQDIIEILRDRISFESNFKKNNKVTVYVEMQDAMVAAQINYLILKKLEEYVIEYRTKKAQDDLDFVSARYEEAKDGYIEAQQNLASYRDRNKNVVLASVQAEEDRLEAEYNLASDLYNTISLQLEQANIKVQENTPVVIVMDPASVPLEKASPKTTVVLISLLLLGGVIGVGLVFLKSAFRKFKKEVLNKD